MEVGALIAASFTAVKTFAAKLVFSAGMKAGLAAWGSVLTYGGMAASLLMKPPSLGSAVHQISMQPAGADSPIPLVFGRTRTGGFFTYRDVHRDNIHNTNKSNNLTFESVVSAGPVHDIRDFKVTGNLIHFNSNPMRRGSATGQSMCVGVQGFDNRSRVFKDGIHMAYRVGDLNDTRTLRSITGQNYVPNITPAHRMSGLASFVAQYILDGSKNLRFPTGYPDSPSVLVDGLLCYDPRKDSSNGFGSGSHRVNDRSTWQWSENPYVCALTFLLGGQGRTGKRSWGVGASIDQIDVAAFAYAANVADLHGWKMGGQVTTGDDKEAVLANMLSAGAGQLVPSGFKISVYVNEPKTSVFTIDQKMLVGDQTIKPARPFVDRFNRIVVKYREPNDDYNLISGTDIVAENWQAIDGVTRTTEVSFPLIQNAGQAAKMAAYVLVNSREYEIDLTLNADAAGLQVGDQVTLNFAIGAVESQNFIVKTFTWNPAEQTVDLTLVSESAGKHEFALGKTATAPAPARIKSFEALNPTAPTGWTIVANQVAGTDGVKYPAFVIEGAGDEAIQKIIVEIREYDALQGPFDNWRIANEYDPAAEQLIVADGLSANAAYDVAVSYRSNAGAMTPRLVFENVLSGANEINWNSEVIVDRPAALVEMSDGGLIKAEFIALEDEANRTLANAIATLDEANLDLSNSVADAWSIIGESDEDGLRKIVADLQENGPDGQLVGRVEALEVSNAAVTSSILDLQTAQINLEDGLATKASASDLTNLASRVTSTEGDIDAQAGRLTNVEASNANKANVSDLTTLQGRVGTAESMLSAQNSRLSNVELEVGNKANSSRVDLIEASLTHLPNLLTNSDATGGADGWVLTGVWTVHHDAAYGSMFMSLGGPSEYSYAYQDAPAYENTDYTLSWTGDGGIDPSRMNVYVHCLGPAGNDLGVFGNVKFDGLYWNSRKSFSFKTVAGTASIRVVFQKNNTSIAGYNAFFSRVMLNVGSNAARWSNDTQTRSLSSKITSTQNAIIDLQNNKASASSVTQLQAQIISKPNLVPNPTAAAGMEGWTNHGNIGVNAEPLSVDGARFISYFSPNTSQQWARASTAPISYPAGYHVAISAEVYAAGYLNGNNATRVFVSCRNAAGHDIDYCVAEAYGNTSGWVTIKREGYVTPAGTTHIQVHFDVYNGSNSGPATFGSASNPVAAWRNIKVENSATATGWNDAATVTQMHNVVAGVSAQSSLILSAGKVAGYKINASQNSSTFDVLADNFRVTNGSSSQVVFETVSNKLLIKNAMIENLTVSKLGDGTLNSQINMGSGKIVFDNGSIMQVMGLGFGVGNEFIEWFGPKMPIANCSRANATAYKTVTGVAYFGGALSAGVLTTKAATSSLAANAEAETSTFGSNGRQIRVTVGYAYESSGGWQQFTGPWPPSYNQSGSNSAVIKLYRSINNAAYVEVATLNANGSWSDVGVMDGDYYYTSQNSHCGGSITYTDSVVSTQNRRYKAVVVTRGVNTYSYQSQNLSVICVEE